MSDMTPSDKKWPNDGIATKGIVKEEPNALGISDGELQDLADRVNGTQEAQSGLTGQTIIRYKEKCFAIDLCSCGSRNISFRGKHLEWLECDNCGNKSAIFDDHPEDCVSSWNALGAKLSHASADAFWKYWRENGETHKHGYYEATGGGIRAAIAHGEQEAQDESQNSANEIDANSRPQAVSEVGNMGMGDIRLELNAQLEALRESLTDWFDRSLVAENPHKISIPEKVDRVSSLVRPYLEQWAQKVVDETARADGWMRDCNWARFDRKNAEEECDKTKRALDETRFSLTTRINELCKERDALKAEVARLREAICETLDEIAYNPEMSHVRALLKPLLLAGGGA